MVALNTEAAPPAAGTEEQPSAANTAGQGTSAPAVAGGTVTESQLRTNEPAGIDTEGFSADAPQAEAAPASTVDTLLIIELVLGATALAFGIGAIVAWRRKL
jgi:hypothetical protein